MTSILTRRKIGSKAFEAFDELDRCDDEREERQGQVLQALLSLTLYSNKCSEKV